jgi:hypothetical protein
MKTKKHYNTKRLIAPSKAIAISILLLANSLCLYAVTTYDTSTGIGHIDAATLQQGFQWNQGQLNRYAGSLTFSYDDNEWYYCTCNTNGGAYQQSVIVTQTTPIASVIVYSGANVTGANLNGYSGPAVQTGTTPQIGGTCSVQVHRNVYSGTFTSVMWTGGQIGVFGKSSQQSGTRLAELYP